MVMTPKEKAKELYHRYHALGSDFTRGVSMHEFAKQCALIAVDEILESQPSYNYWNTYYDEEPSAITFWTEVKHEIEKL